MVAQELTGTRGRSARDVAVTRRASALEELRRAVAVGMVFGLLMALWVMLWIPSAPAP
jgi:hypothetical protein